MSDARQPDASKATPPRLAEENRGHEEAAAGRPGPAQSSEPARRKVSKEEIAARRDAHELWLKSGKEEDAQFDSGEDEDLSGADLGHVNLSRAKLKWANLSGAELFEANLSGAALVRADLSKTLLRSANLSGAELHKATLDGADVSCASLVGASGLFGRDRAGGLGTVKNAEWAVYSHKRDFAHWAILRFVGTLHLFSASYVVFIAVTIYATAMRWLNSHVGLLHEWADERGGGPAAEIAALVARIPLLPVQRHFGVLLLATFLLAVAKTLHALFCPELIKEATETRWTRELNQPLIEYRSAMYSRFWVRYFTFVFFVLGGGYTLGYLVWRAARALWFLLFS